MCVFSQSKSLHPTTFCQCVVVIVVIRYRFKSRGRILMVMSYVCFQPVQVITPHRVVIERREQWWIDNHLLTDLNTYSKSRYVPLYKHSEINFEETGIFMQLFLFCWLIPILLDYGQDLWHEVLSSWEAHVGVCSCMERGDILFLSCVSAYCSGSVARVLFLECSVEEDAWFGWWWFGIVLVGGGDDDGAEDNDDAVQVLETWRATPWTRCCPAKITKRRRRKRRRWRRRMKRSVSLRAALDYCLFSHSCVGKVFTGFWAFKFHWSTLWKLSLPQDSCLSPRIVPWSQWW